MPATGRDPVAHRDPDQQVGDPPDDRDGGEGHPGASRHRWSTAPLISSDRSRMPSGLRVPSPEPVDQPQEIERAERLRQKQVGAGLLRLTLDVVAGTPRSASRSSCRRGRVRSRSWRHASMPSSARHVDVEEHQRGQFAPCHLQRFDAVGRLMELELGPRPRASWRSACGRTDRRRRSGPTGSSASRHRISEAIRSKVASGIELKASRRAGRSGSPPAR